MGLVRDCVLNYISNSELLSLRTLDFNIINSSEYTLVVNALVCCRNQFLLELVVLNHDFNLVETCCDQHTCQSGVIKPISIIKQCLKNGYTSIMHNWLFKQYPDLGFLRSCVRLAFVYKNIQLLEWLGELIVDLQFNKSDLVITDIAFYLQFTDCLDNIHVAHRTGLLYICLGLLSTTGPKLTQYLKENKVEPRITTRAWNNWNDVFD